MTVEEFKAYACHGKGQPLKEWTYKPRPLGDEDVEVEISHCGICASDIHSLDSGWSNTHYPIVVGHEMVGKIVAKGSKVTEKNVGDLVGVGGQLWSCSACEDCEKGDDHLCPKRIFAYNRQYPDGEWTKGGFAEGIRVHQKHVFKIPDNLPSDVAAPLLCAGITTYNPLRRFGAGPGKKVGVVGIGGLGHLAVQFAHKMGAEVVAISHSMNKKDQAKQLGATEFLNISDEEAVKERVRSMDIFIVTSNHKGQPWTKYMSLVKPHGTLVLLAAPEEPVSFNPVALFMNEIQVAGSCVGSTSMMQEMLEFAAEYDVKPWIETKPMSHVNEALQDVRDGKPRYRIVLEARN